MYGLCMDCHQLVHETETISIYDEESMEVLHVLEDCERCGGVGYIPKFYYVQDGICFESGGSGSFPGFLPGER
jgi:hypothetical protein